MTTKAESAPSPTSENQPSGALGKTVGGGMTWMLIATVISKLATSVAQGLLGWWLLPEHFARFALATTAAGFLMVAKDGSIPNWLIQKGESKYNELSSRAFFFCLAYNIAAAALMAILAWPLAVYWFHDEKIAPMLWFMAASLPLGSPFAISQAKMRLSMNFKPYVTILTYSGILRQVVTIALAFLGFAELSLAIPIVVTAAFESVAGYFVCRDKPWQGGAFLSAWRGIFRETYWLMQATVANFATDWGPYMVLGRALTTQGGKDQLGYYFFAYQITAQIGVLLSNNLFVVFMSAFGRLKDEPARFAQAYLRGLRTLMLTGSIASIGLASIMAPLENLIWQGKWSVSVGAVIILGAFYSWKTTFGISAAALIGLGRFKTYSLATWVEGLIIMASAVGAAFYSPTAAGISLWTGVALLVSRLLIIFLTMRILGQKARQLFRATFPAWAVALIAGGAGLFVDHSLEPRQWLINALPLGWLLQDSLVVSLAGSLFKDLGLLRLFASMGIDVFRCLLAGSTCTLVFVVLARGLLAQDVRDTLEQAPSKLRIPLQRLLRFN